MTIKELKDFLDLRCNDKPDTMIYGSFNDDDFFAAKSVSIEVVNGKQLLYFKF